MVGTLSDSDPILTARIPNPLRYRSLSPKRKSEVLRQISFRPEVECTGPSLEERGRARLRANPELTRRLAGIQGTTAQEAESWLQPAESHTENTDPGKVDVWLGSVEKDNNAGGGKEEVEEGEDKISNEAGLSSSESVLVMSSNRKVGAPSYIDFDMPASPSPSSRAEMPWTSPTKLRGGASRRIDAHETPLNSEDLLNNTSASEIIFPGRRYMYTGQVHFMARLCLDSDDAGYEVLRIPGLPKTSAGEFHLNMQTLQSEATQEVAVSTHERVAFVDTEFVVHHFDQPIQRLPYCGDLLIRLLCYQPTQVFESHDVHLNVGTVMRIEKAKDRESRLVTFELSCMPEIKAIFWADEVTTKFWLQGGPPGMVAVQMNQQRRIELECATTTCITEVAVTQRVEDIKKPFTIVLQSPLSESGLVPRVHRTKPDDRRSLDDTIAAESSEVPIGLAEPGAYTAVVDDSPTMIEAIEKDIESLRVTVRDSLHRFVGEVYAMTFWRFVWTMILTYLVTKAFFPEALDALQNEAILTVHQGYRLAVERFGAKPDDAGVTAFSNTTGVPEMAGKVLEQITSTGVLDRIDRFLGWQDDL